ncbi:MAG: hypothetical protein KC413_08650, partial [Anaerolineales bacterium]|nr:hypothetical protein [Anaerolineales bacterium]
MPLRQPALSGPERAEAAYKWSYNNPLNFIDPSGHCATNPDGTPDISTDPECWYQYNWILDTIFDGDIS